MLEVALSDADGQMTDLVTRAEAGEEVVLTRNGRATVRLTPIETTGRRTSSVELERVFAEIEAAARARPSPGPSAARSQDFLYDDDGLPA